MKIEFDDFGFSKRFTLKPYRQTAPWWGLTLYEVNLGWVWFSFWVRK